MVDFAGLVKEWSSTAWSSYGPKVIGVLIILVVGYIIIKIISKALYHFFEKAEFEPTIEVFMQKVIKAFLWVILLLVVLNNLGVQVGPLIAGLGIAGFVIGFALQDTLSNFASGIFIMFYKPFKVGDWINVNNIVGGVEDIGIAATTLHSPDNTKIVIPNSKIWGNTIQNYTANPTRKLFNLTVSISYDDDISKAIKVIKNVLDGCDKVMKQPEPQIVVTEHGDSAIKIAVRPTVKNADYWDAFFYLNKTIKEEFDRNKITIPYPQRDVHLKRK
jgi:small conductance mechanosensitive channel